ncbi:MAG TPA: threonine synthase [Methylomirabilota bacterium]|nr:threonine synthase [Methylomirabilota bacterium]
MSGFVAGLECARCRRVYAGDATVAMCECGSPLLVRYDLAAIARAVTPADIARRPPTMWRYRELLPVRDEASIVTMSEGFTPMIPVPRAAREAGVGELWVKDEGVNPTGTFKARGASAAISRWKELGVTKFAQPTVGSGGHAWAAYGARAGVEVHTALPVECPELGWKGSRANGAHVYRVDGTVGDVFRIMTEAAARYGWLNAGAGREPYRVEGKKTMGIEVVEQLGWQVPDAIVYPTGGGVGIIGMWKVFDELEQLGWIGSARPRLVSAQVAGGAVVKAFHEGLEECLGAGHVDTIAPGIMVVKPFADFLILRALRATKGWAVGVPDAEMLSVMARVDRTEGLLLSPEGAATIAAVRAMVREGQLGSRSRVVVFNTATGLRYPHLMEGKVPVIAGDGAIDDAVVAAAARAAAG